MTFRTDSANRLFGINNKWKKHLCKNGVKMFTEQKYVFLKKTKTDHLFRYMYFINNEVVLSVKSFVYLGNSA